MTFGGMWKGRTDFVCGCIVDLWPDVLRVNHPLLSYLPSCQIFHIHLFLRPDGLWIASGHNSKWEYCNKTSIITLIPVSSWPWSLFLLVGCQQPACLSVRLENNTTGFPVINPGGPSCKRDVESNHVCREHCKSGILSNLMILEWPGLFCVESII